MRLPRRMYPALWITVAATLASIGLAIGPNIRGTYAPDLGVLTATLIAVIWYTFFSYVALDRHERPRVIMALEREPEDRRILRFTVRNPTQERRLEVIGLLETYRAGKVEHIEGTFITDNPGDAIDLAPGRRFHMTIVVEPARGKEGSDIGPGVQLGEPEKFGLRARLAWKDDLGDVGVTPVEYWSVDVRSLDVAVLGTKRQIESVFSGAPPLRSLDRAKRLLLRHG